jgi:hypothetical protein
LVGGQLYPLDNEQEGEEEVEVGYRAERTKRSLIHNIFSYTSHLVGRSIQV